MKAIATIGIALLLLAGALRVSSQATAYANIYATVIAPVGIVNNAETNVGNITISKSNSSLSILKGTEISASGVKLEQNGTATLATFSVTDYNNSTFDITLPNENLTIGAGNANAMTVSNFNSINTLSSSFQNGRREVRIGANLHVAENLAFSNSTTQESFPVTLNYN